MLARTSRLFFDASCLFAAAHSPPGGSAYLLEVCARGYLQAIVSLGVLIEAERNIADKLTIDVLVRFRELIGSTPFIVAPMPPSAQVKVHEATFMEDAHVIAAALAASADFLITLDRRLARRVGDAGLGIVALSPKTFLQEVFPEHPEYLSIRRQ